MYISQRLYICIEDFLKTLISQHFKKAVKNENIQSLMSLIANIYLLSHGLDDHNWIDLRFKLPPQYKI